MKFIKQISDDEFIVKMGPEDADKTRKIVIAHDYLQFRGRDSHYTDMHGLTAPWGCGNVVNNECRIQIPIRMAQDMLNNVINTNRKYLKEEHLVRDGKNVYCDNKGNCYRYYTDNNKEMIAVYDSESDEYVHLPVSIYNSICQTLKYST